MTTAFLLGMILMVKIYVFCLFKACMTLKRRIRDIETRLSANNL